MKKLPLIFIFLLTCTYFQKRLAIKNCKFYFKDAKVERVGLTDLDLKTFIEVKNPNSIEVLMEKFTYDFYVNNISTFNGVFSQKPKGQSWWNSNRAAADISLPQARNSFAHAYTFAGRTHVARIRILWTRINRNHAYFFDFFFRVWYY